MSVALLAGCASRQVVLNTYLVDALSDGEVLPRLSCVLPRYELVDLRKHQTMGWAGRREVRYPEIMGWLERSIGAVAKQDEAAPPITIALSIAHMESQLYGHSFQLVLRARDAGDDRSQWRTYRGSIANLTWFGHDGELAGHVKDAGAVAIRELVKNEGRCVSRSS